MEETIRYPKKKMYLPVMVGNEKLCPYHIYEKEFVERIEIYQTEHVCKKGSEAQNRMEVYWLLRSTTDRRQRENGIAA